MYVMKLDSEGEIVAQVRYPATSYEWVEYIIEDREGNIVIVTADDLPPNSKGGTILTKFSPDLELLVRKAYTLDNYFYSSKIISLSDGGYLVSG